SDIDPSTYGAERHPETGEPYPPRDRFEIALTRRALERDMPVLGVCRGMQLLDVACGGTLIQHLEQVARHRHTPGAFGDHGVVLEPGSLAARAIGDVRSTVKSHHHQGVDRLGQRLVVTGHSEEDGLIEAIEIPGRRFVVGEMGMVAETFRYYAGAPERLLGDTIPVAGGVNMTFREPLGVVGLIVPWNFPLTIASWKMAPALAAGNTLVLKPAELTPLSALEFERLALEAGIPEGVVNVVAGPGSVCGRRLVEHPGVAKIAFTGSTAVGRGIAEAAAATIKRVTLELGGKSANVVFADADLEKAAAAAPGAVFGNAGQDCCARSRILVE